MLSAQGARRRVANALSTVIPALGNTDGACDDDELALELEKQMRCIEPNNPPPADDAPPVVAECSDSKEVVQEAAEEEQEPDGPGFWRQLLFAVAVSTPGQQPGAGLGSPLYGHPFGYSAVPYTVMQHTAGGAGPGGAGYGGRPGVPPIGWSGTPL